MDSPILKQIAKFLQDRKKHKHWLVIFTCMAVLVGLGTVTALKLMGQAMTRKEKVLNCSLEVHAHTEECRDAEGNLICGLADYVVHTHNDDCYDAEGNVVCTLAELPAHVHTEECYADQEVLICELEEAEGHVHDEACYTKKVTGLQCQSPEHAHGTGCFDENGSLICEAPEHQHAAECYDEAGNLICGQASHTHMANCFDADNNIICTAAEHVHGAECLAVEDTLVCELEEGADGHAHAAECYEKRHELACGQLELHTHAAECFEEVQPEAEGGEVTQRLICALPVLEEHIHSEEAGCFVIVEAAVDEVPEDVIGTEAAENTEAVQSTETAAGTEAAQPAETEAVQSTEASAETETTETAEFFKACEGDGFIVSVTYGAEAKIPEEAELVAEMITQESDPERYAEREAECRKQIDDEEAEMNALLKIGFYLDGEEIEPQAPVQVSLQLLDENGLPEGKPMSVVHFADEGSRVLEGSLVEGGKTSFETDRFCEFGFIVKSDEPSRIEVDEECEYEDDDFKISLHIEGVAKMPSGMAAPLPEDKTSAETEAGNELQEDSAVEDDANVPADTDVLQSIDEETQSAEDVAADEEELSTEKAEEEPFQEENDTEDSTEGLKLNVELLSENSDEHRAYAAFVKEENDGNDADVVRTWTYSLTYNGEKLDVSQCKVTADITPVSESDTGSDADTEEQTATEILVMTMSRNKVKTVDSMLLNDAEEDVQLESDSMTVEVMGDTFGSSKSPTPNPPFTVQYYANIDRFATSGNNTAGSLDIIDTTGKRLPKNGQTPATKKFYLKREPAVGVVADRTEVEMFSQTMEVYSQREYTYIKAPSLNYFDALIENNGYELKEIWVLKENKSSVSVRRDDWDIYRYGSGIHFTNRIESATAKPGSDSGYIYIKDNAVIRLVYDTTKNDTSEYDAVFYDYDISNGKIYDGNKLATGHAGINSGLKKKATGKPEDGQYAFGNGDWSDFGYVKWNNNTLNKANGIGYSNCTFGLVTDVNGESVTFAPGITAPKIFGTDTVEGKKRYPDGTLTFKRNGDSYTLRMAEVRNGSQTSRVENLDKFWWRKGWSVPKIWSNNFWPLDGIKGADPLMGAVNGQYEFTGSTMGSGSDSSKSSPEADDKNNHNYLFGMYYEVDFDLSSEYTGPLEYVFFGDDDMWVFLDGQLVCDIGGVHGSVGEYVDLWDYLGSKNSDGTLKKDADGKVAGIKSGSHRLQFFYTERGLTGSTCWMHFTLPSVTSREPEDNKKDYGHLKVSKTVTDKKTEAEKETDDEFEFTITLEKPKLDAQGNPVLDANGKPEMIPLPDDYSYWKYNEGEDEPIEYDLIIQDGGHFKLKNNQYIVIRYLPQGTEYTIEEIQYPEYETEINGNPSSDRRITGTIAVGTEEQITMQEVNYNNVFSAYELPETGGTGKTPYTMAGIIAVFGAGFLYRKKFRERRV